MRSYRKELIMEVPRRRAIINITGEVEAALVESGIREGLARIRRQLMGQQMSAG